MIRATSFVADGRTPMVMMVWLPLAAGPLNGWPPGARGKIVCVYANGTRHPYNPFTHSREGARTIADVWRVPLVDSEGMSVT